MKTVGNLAKASRVTFCFGCSSWVMETTPFLVLIERDAREEGERDRKTREVGLSKDIERSHAFYQISAPLN